MVRIRPYRPTDHGAGRQLWVELIEEQRELYDDASIGGADPGAAFEEYLTRLDLTGVWVAEDDDGVLGLVGLVLNGRAGEVEPIVVTRVRRGQGIGKALLAHVAEQARQRGLAYLTIRPSSRNEAAIRCFHAAGYDVLSAIELSLDLGPASRKWQEGPGLQGLKFRH